MSARASSSGSRKSADSARSTDSYASVLSEDSYLETFKPIDADFTKFLDAFEKDILMARKVQSHNLKKRDQKDTERRTDWTDAMEKAYAAYKNKVVMLSKAKKTQAESELAAKKSGKKSIKEQEAARNKALADDEAWLLAGIAAADARLGFMKKYPNALSTPTTATHIKAAEDNLNSARRAQREINIQKSKIAGMKDIEAKKAAASKK
ncbi:hypothetical protein BT67DRAFT_438305 [Trichocladium antarcticum]|uniref:Uncharacterized protein n=1 Tax=Trichocladium antarcticum TaxID=1450529 RepID=A0AAN6UUT5_9PEZI|nr:hypothetical protein BT67DRAFT_438305 [Trichocladium antarcticum]